MHAPPSLSLRAEWRELSALEPIAEQWRSLEARAIESNVFYGPDFATAAAPVFGTGCRALLVWSKGGRLMGFFPSSRTGFRHASMPATMGWVHPYAPLGTPLVDRDDAEAVIACWLDHLASDPAAPALLLLPQLPDNGPFARALDGVLTHHGLHSATFDRHRRALLKPGNNQDDHSASPRRRKELMRQRRRLDDFAPVTFDSARDPADVARAVEDFLVLEAGGWKGIAGTAAANDPAVRRFVETAVGRLAANGHARIDRMQLAERTIAVAITLTSGDTGWFWKTAYNEGVGRFSPGVQLVHEITPELAGLNGPVRIDSCAVADHPMIDRIWHGRLALGDRLIALKKGVLPFGLICHLETLRRAALSSARSVRDRVRNRSAYGVSAAGAQQPSNHFSGRGHRHLRDEGDLARILVGGQAGSHETLNVGRERI
jgi:CelD/BcsL family acetyltransferase involved in cellulose biosynthesis